MKGALTQSVNANNSRGRSAHPKTPSDPEATEISYPHVATTTTAVTTDVATKTTIIMTIGDVAAASRRTDATSATYLPRRRQAIPTAKDMIVCGLKSSTSRRRYHKDNREVKLIHTKPSLPLRWSE
jgi:hypothetical protein